MLAGHSAVRGTRTPGRFLTTVERYLVGQDNARV